MTITIPVWLLWTLGIGAGLVALYVLVWAALCMWLGNAFARAVGRGLNW